MKDLASTEQASADTRGQGSQHVLKAEAARPDATDRETPANASPVGGPMGVGQPAAAGPVGGRRDPRPAFSALLYAVTTASAAADPRATADDRSEAGCAYEVAERAIDKLAGEQASAVSPPADADALVEQALNDAGWELTGNLKTDVKVAHVARTAVRLALAAHVDGAVSPPALAKLPPLPFAVFDEFGASCEDRVQDHYASALEQQQGHQSEPALAVLAELVYCKDWQARIATGRKEGIVPPDVVAGAQVECDRRQIAAWKAARLVLHGIGSEK